jgi:hypothetical protein
MRWISTKTSDTHSAIIVTFMSVQCGVLRLLQEGSLWTGSWSIQKTIWFSYVILGGLANKYKAYLTAFICRENNYWARFRRLSSDDEAMKITRATSPKQIYFHNAFLLNSSSLLKQY